MTSTDTRHALLRFFLLTLSCGIRRKFGDVALNQHEKVEMLEKLFHDCEKLKRGLEEAFERTMQVFFVGLKRPWLALETNGHDFAQAFGENITTPVLEREGMTGPVQLTFLDGFFLDYDTVVEAVGDVLNHEELSANQLFEILLSTPGSDDIDQLATAAQQQLNYGLTQVIGLEPEHPIVAISGFQNTMLNGVLQHVYEVVTENAAWSHLVDYLSDEGFARDNIRAIISRDAEFQRSLQQETIVFDRLKSYRNNTGEVLDNRDWLFDIADRLEDQAEDIDSEIRGQVILTQHINSTVGTALAKTHEVQDTAQVVSPSAGLERPSNRAVKMLGKIRLDFCYAKWDDPQYPVNCRSLGAALWPVAGPRLSERYFREARAFMSDNPELCFNLFMLELQKERYGRTLDYLNQTLALDRENYEPFDTGTYKIVRVVGAGGAGVTYEVQGPGDERLVVKSLWDEMSVVDPRPALKALNQFVTEPIAGTEPVKRLLAHRRSKTCVVSEFVDGDDLESFRKARGGKIPLIQLLELGYRIAVVLATAHDKDLIHRNLKPENVLVGATDTGIAVTLLDFAVPNLVTAKTDRIDGVRRFAAWSRLGRKISEALANYSAPEVLAGGAAVATVKADIYSFGATLYHLVTGLPARDFQSDNVPDELKEVVTRCISKDPRVRPDSMKLVVEALGKIGRAVNTGQPLQGPLFPPVAAPQPTPPPQPKPTPQRNDEIPEIDFGMDLSALPDDFGGAPAGQKISDGFQSPDNFGLTSGIQPGGPDPLAGMAGNDPFNMQQPGSLGFGGGPDFNRPPSGEDPFGLQSSAGLPSIGGDPLAGLAAPSGANADPFGVSSSEFQAPGMGVQGNDPFNLSGSGDFGAPAGLAPADGMANDPLAGFAQQPPPAQGNLSMEESLEEEPLDPMEALRILEGLTGTPGDPGDAPSEDAVQRFQEMATNKDFFNLDAPNDDFSMGLGDDPFGGLDSDDPFGASGSMTGGDPFGGLNNNDSLSDLAGLGGPAPAGDPLGLPGDDPFGQSGSMDGFGTPGDLSLDPPPGLDFDLGSPAGGPAPDLGDLSFSGEGALPGFQDSGELTLPPDFNSGLESSGSQILSGNQMELPSDLGGGLDDLSLPNDIGDVDLSLPSEGLDDILKDFGPPPGAPAAPAKKPSAPKKPQGKRAKRGKRGKGGDDEQTFGVMITGLGLKSKKEAAVKIIVELTGKSEDEARDQCRAAVVPVLKRVTKAKADAAMAKFKAAKINCRLNRQKGRRR